jgi:hypothetical protein
MAIKRRREHGDGAVDSPAELAESRGDGTLGSSSPSSSSEFAKSIYLVAEQEINEQSSAAHSIIKIDADAAAAGDDEPRRVLTQNAHSAPITQQAEKLSFARAERE